MDNIANLSVTDVTTDLINAFDGHTADNYFDDGSSVTYDVNASGERDGRIEVVATDDEGNKRTFIVSVREA